MAITDEQTCLCALGTIFGFEPKTALALISYAGNAASVFRLTEDELKHLLGPYSRNRWKISNKALDEAYRTLVSLQDKGIYFIGYTENGYPDLLKECEDAPAGLYVRSDTPPEELWAPERSISIVGTRDISPYGKEWCEKIVSGLASSEERPLIISGLALGTDICAHKCSLEAGLPTIAVMATGPESIYPHRNEATARLMARTPGCALVTDYPPGTSPLPVHFLRRNRIIAGMAQATILVESKIKGGGMMTSRLAFSYNREVYALPGRADDLRSQGCNRLIREKIAEPLTSIPEMLESLGMKSRRIRSRPDIREVILSIYSGNMDSSRIDLMQTIISSIDKERGITLEGISEKTGIPYHAVRNLCSIMESDGLISTDLLQRCSIRSKNF